MIDEITEYDYETSFRAGGGYAIAALAYAARVTYRRDYTKDRSICKPLSAPTIICMQTMSCTQTTANGTWSMNIVRSMR